MKSQPLGKPMTNDEVQAYVQGIKDFTKEIAKSPKKSLNFLVTAGILTPKGKLTKRYRV